MNTGNKPKRSDEVSARIRAHIADGTYRKGEKIPTEPELMEIYGVGRSSIREAVKSLAMAGILHVQQGAGTTVNADHSAQSLDEKIRRADFDEVNAVRTLLEKETVTLAAAHRSNAHLQEMEQWLTKRREAIETGNRQQCIAADIAFHQAIAAASGNSVLAGLYQSFTEVIRHFFKEREQQGVSHFAFSHHLHEQLFQAIKAKKAKAAQAAMQQILLNNY